MMRAKNSWRNISWPWFQTGMATGPWISGFSDKAPEHLQQREYLGFDIGDVERSILAARPPDVLEAAAGRFDPQATEASLAACADCPQPEIVEHQGTSFYSWGADHEVDMERSLNPPAFDQLGRGGRIAVLDSHVFRTVATGGMKALIETHLDNVDSLADDPDLALAAAALDGLGAYSGLLVGNVGNFVTYCDDCTAEEWAQLEAEVEHTLDVYSLLGVGVTRDEDGFFALLVFVYDNEDAASRNVPVFEERLATGVSLMSKQPWTDLFTAGEAWHEGRALVARMRTEFPWIWQQMVYNLDSLLWHK